MNDTIRQEIAAAGLRHWQVADALGVSCVTLSRWFGAGLTIEQAAAIRKAVTRLSK